MGWSGNVGLLDCIRQRSSWNLGRVGDSHDVGFPFDSRQTLELDLKQVNDRLPLWLSHLFQRYIASAVERLLLHIICGPVILGSTK